MQIDIEKARAVLARLESATGPDRELDRATYLALGASVQPGAFEEGECGIRWPGGFQERMSELSASLDAADALRRRVLPDSERRSGDAEPAIFDPDYQCVIRNDEVTFLAFAATEPIAILIATIRALIAREEGQ